MLSKTFFAALLLAPSVLGIALPEVQDSSAIIPRAEDVVAASTIADSALVLPRDGETELDTEATEDADRKKKHHRHHKGKSFHRKHHKFNPRDDAEVEAEQEAATPASEDATAEPEDDARRKHHKHHKGKRFHKHHKGF